MRRLGGFRGGRASGISFVILYKIRLCRASVATGRAGLSRIPDPASVNMSGKMSNKMWGGRFTERPDAIMEEINVSIDVDRHLFAQDIAASKAHAAMLSAQGIITANDAKNIAKVLDTILSEIGEGSFVFKRPIFRASVAVIMPFADSIAA